MHKDSSFINKNNLVLFLIFSKFIYAQNGNYSSENYGEKSTLLNGTVIGSVEDLGAIYYNPARLSLIKKTAFTFSLKAYEISSSNLKNASGKKTASNNLTRIGSPSLVAGTFKFKNNKNHVFAYSYLTRQKRELNIGSYLTVQNDQISRYKDEEFFKIEDEKWFGLSWAHKIYPNFSIGLSSFGTFRKQSGFIEVSDYIYSYKDLIVSDYFKKYISGYRHIGIIFKGGIAYEQDNLKLGLTFATPKISLIGKGYVEYANIYINQLNKNGLPIEDTYEFTSEKINRVVHKTPFLLGLGTGYKFKSHIFHFDLEWYSSINEYQVMRSVSFIGQTSQVPIIINLKQKIQSVLNIGVGAELNINKRLTSFISFSTDFNAIKNGYTLNYNGETKEFYKFISSFYNVGGGINYNRSGWGNISLGVNYSISNQSIPEPFIRELLPEPSIMYPDKTIFSQYRYQFFVAVSLPFLKGAIKNKLDFISHIQPQDD